MILSIIVASLHCQDRRKIWKSRGINDYAVGIIYPTALIEIGLNNVSAKIWKGNCPRYLPFPTALQVGPFMYSIFPHIFYGFKSVYYFQTFLLFHGDFFQFQFGFRTRRTIWSFHVFSLRRLLFYLTFWVSRLKMTSQCQLNISNS